jgi:hypothetical protein
LRHDLEECYKHKLKDFERSRARHLANRNREREVRSDRDHRGKSEGRTTGKDSRLDDRKAPPEGSAKKPCHIHGSGSKHSYSECRENPKNRAANNNNNYYNAKKHTHDAHHHDDCRLSSGEEEAYESLAGPACSEGEVSASESCDGTPAENYHLVGHKSPKKQTPCGAVVKRTKKKDKKSSSSTKMASSSEPKLNLKDFFPMM